MAIKGGRVEVVGSVVRGTGAAQEPGASKSGFTDTGDGIYIETNYDNDIELTISGESVIESIHGRSLQVYEPDATNVVVRIISGIFDQVQPEEYIDADSQQDGRTVTEKDKQ